MKIWFILGWMLLFSWEVLARPVSYSGGMTVMQMNDAISNALHVHYSPSFNYSLGYKVENFRVDEVVLNGVQVNYLGKRWNQKESQGNVYFMANAGDAYHSGERELYGSAGMMADFETRRYFVSYANKYLRSEGGMMSMFTQKARVGVAPYVAPYGSLHSWLMVQVQHQPKYNGDQQVITTPMVRFFKGPHMAEFGVSSNKKMLFNFIARF